MLEKFLQCINKYKENPEFEIQKQSFHPKLLEKLQKSVEEGTKISEKSNLHIFREGELFFKESAPKNITELNQLAKKENFTYRIHGHHFNNPTLLYMKDYFELNLKIQSHANLYVTRKGHQTLAKHRDRYTVLVLQIKGSKKWFFDKEEFSTNPGDFFVLPVGREHYAISEDNEDSYHISFGIQFPSIFQILHFCALDQNTITDFSNKHKIKHLEAAKELTQKMIENTNFFEEGIRNFEKVLCSLRLNPKNEPINPKKVIDLNKNLTLDLQKIAFISDIEDSNLKITLLNNRITFKNKESIAIFKDLISLKESSLNNLSRTYPPSLVVKTLTILKNYKILTNS